MIYKIKESHDKNLIDIYTRAMADLEELYRFKWTKNRPRIILVEDRNMIDSLQGEKTENWFIGWSEGGRNIFVLDIHKMAKESSHKKSPEEYECLVKHELSHAFLRVASGFAHYIPTWFNEGIAIYFSGQNKYKKPAVKFDKFLGYYDKDGSGAYYESGFAIEALVNKFGKIKLSKLIAKLKNIKNKKDFIALFKAIYKSDPSYGYFNELISKKIGSKI